MVKKTTDVQNFGGKQRKRSHALRKFCFIPLANGKNIPQMVDHFFIFINFFFTVEFSDVLVTIFFQKVTKFSKKKIQKK